MNTVLEPKDFSGFFQDVHGFSPFPWQVRLAEHVAATGQWPRMFDLPTSSGKTSVLDIAVFHLALEADRKRERRAAVRIIMAVDRRLIVDDTFRHAQRLASALSTRQGTTSSRVANRLQWLAEDGTEPLVVRRLRGGIAREDDWARTPTQPTVLCSTIDQIGSRLLFRGYGSSNSAKPIHAGLIGSDCRIFLDEAHLAEPFRQTLEWVNTYRGANWQQEPNAPGGWGVSLLTATPGDGEAAAFRLESADYQHTVFSRRWTASKPVRLVELSTPSKKQGQTTADLNSEKSKVDELAKDQSRRTDGIASEVYLGLEELQRSGIRSPAIGAVVNRVATARSVFEKIRRRFEDKVDVILMIGPARAVDRDQVVDALEPIHTSSSRSLERPLIVVATQCIEAGVDIDLDGLVSEAASFDALVQRFGRMNRAGRDIRSYGAIVALKSELSSRSDDPVYGKSIAATWKVLQEESLHRSGKAPSTVEFSLAGVKQLTERRRTTAMLAPKVDAPVLLPAHLDLLSQTSPISSADPDVSLYLHGAQRQSTSVSVIWRADISSDTITDRNARQLLVLMPPRMAEAINLPLWSVRRWLQRTQDGIDNLADVANVAEEMPPRREYDRVKVFRWAGDNDSSQWVRPSQIRPGDTIIVPADIGGADMFGWSPSSREAVTDVAIQAAEAFSGSRFSLRIAPGLLQSDASESQLAEVLSTHENGRWQDLRDALVQLHFPEAICSGLQALQPTNLRSPRKVYVYLDLYHRDRENRPRGVVFFAPFGLTEGRTAEDGSPGSTEDDVAGSMQGTPILLTDHSLHVRENAKHFASLAGLPQARVRDLALAGFLHDVGKADSRFQSLLASGDPLGADPGKSLAKSGHTSVRGRIATAGLPNRWRHEALSVRLAPLHPEFATADDPELVLWLVGTHHGWGRPFFPHVDPWDEDPHRESLSVLGQEVILHPGEGPNSLGYNWNGSDWPTMFQRLQVRYGVWGLAYLEAILRLADHRASETEQRKAGGSDD